MKVVHDIEKCDLVQSGAVATMGNFDGIHLGHQTLIANAVAEAKTRQSLSVVLTFDPHPLKVLAPERAPGMILSQQDKIDMLKAFDVDVVINQRFDRDFANIRADEFITRYLVGHLGLSKIWLGRDLRFGRGRQGGVEDLIRLGGEAGLSVGIVEPISIDGDRVSSSRIRQLINEGRVDEVEPMLGRFHFASGEIVRGDRRGRELGFPTANLSSRTEVLPQNGIYATIFECQNGRWLSVSSIGTNPTFGEGPRKVESFILDFDEMIYGESVKLSFVKRIREERKFACLEDLITEMHRDVEIARSILEQLKVNVSYN